VSQKSEYTGFGGSAARKRAASLRSTWGSAQTRWSVRASHKSDIASTKRHTKKALRRHRRKSSSAAAMTRLVGASQAWR